jgi:hypothetical protein
LKLRLLVKGIYGILLVVIKPDSYDRHTLFWIIGPIMETLAVGRAQTRWWRRWQRPVTVFWERGRTREIDGLQVFLFSIFFPSPTCPSPFFVKKKKKRSNHPMLEINIRVPSHLSSMIRATRVFPRLPSFVNVEEQQGEGYDDATDRNIDVKVPSPGRLSIKTPLRRAQQHQQHPTCRHS